MEYVALTFWILVIVLTALGVHRLWSSLVQPKIVNSVLLPGTLVAQLGHVLGLLITGGTVNNTALIKDDDSGEPQTGQDVKPRVPVIGPVLIALLPMAGCAIAIYWASLYFGGQFLNAMSNISVEEFALPTSLSAFFLMLRQSLTMVERLVEVFRSSDWTNWQTLLFVYLAVCLTVRMAPLTGNLRGAFGAILVFGILAFLFGQWSQARPDALASIWTLITFSAAVLLLLLIVSLVIRGLIDLVKTLFGEAQATPGRR